MQQLYNKTSFSQLFSRAFCTEKGKPFVGSGFSQFSLSDQLKGTLNFLWVL
jgi:hypothetical protein